jgi:hypothetical protein
MPADKLLKKWTDRALKPVAKRVADARAHAEHAARVLNTPVPPGGRFPAPQAEAMARLEALADELAGGTGVLRDAFEAFYRDSWRTESPKVPEAHRNTDPFVEAEGPRRARALTLHGYDARRELAGPVRDAAGRLNQAVLAKARGLGRVDPLDAWDRRASADLARAVTTMLGDARVALRRQAQLDAVKPARLDLSGLE